MTGPVSAHSIELTIILLELFIRYPEYPAIYKYHILYLKIMEPKNADCGVLGLTGRRQPWDTL